MIDLNAFDPDDKGEIDRLDAALQAMAADKAVEIAARLVCLHPGAVDALHLLGVNLPRLRAFVSAHRAAICGGRADPRHYKCAILQGRITAHLGDYASAADHYYRAALFAPDPIKAQLYYEIGHARTSLNRMDLAIGAYTKAVCLDPAGAAAWYNLSCALGEVEAYEPSLIQCRRAAQIDPLSKVLNSGLAFSYMCLGRLVEGQAIYFRRHAGAAYTQNGWRPIPRWDGRQDIGAKRLLVYCEGGYGDAIQYMRYLPLLTDKGWRLAVHVPRGMKAVFKMIPGLDLVVEDGGIPPMADLAYSIMDLAHAFGTDLASIPKAAGYLTPNAAYADKWRTILGDKGKPRIGLAWRGNPSHVNDRRRSLPIGDLGPLLINRDVDWHQVQLGRTKDEQAFLDDHELVLHDHSTKIADLMDTTALIDQMDMIITVDTVSAHLGGALGKPTFVMLPRPCDHRWLIARDTSPWYSTIKLIRQPQAGDWAAVVHALGPELLSLTQGIWPESRANTPNHQNMS
jgi:tetratricopeptide (TPR) repeat protein